MNEWRFRNETSTNGYIWYDDALSEIVDWSARSTTPQHVSIDPFRSTKVAFLEFISVNPKRINNFLPFVREFGPLIPFSTTLQNLKLPGLVNSIGDDPSRESTFFLNHKKPEQTSGFYLDEHFALTYAYDLAVKKDRYPFIGHLSFEDVATPNTKTLIARLKDQYSNVLSDAQTTETKNTIIVQQQIHISTSDDKNISAIAEILRTNIAWRLVAEPMTPFVCSEMLPMMTSPDEYFVDMFYKFPIAAIDFNGSNEINLGTLINIWLDKFITYNSSHYPCEVRHHFDPNQNKWVPLIRPSSLLAAMWYQFTEWLAGNKKYKQCRECKKWMDTTDKNINNDYHDECANKGRVRKWRTKKAAMKLFAEGRSHQEIALKLNQTESDIAAMLSKGSAQNGCEN